MAEGVGFLEKNAGFIDFRTQLAERVTTSKLHSGPKAEIARSGKKRDSLTFSATPPHRGPNREMASCGAFSGKSAHFGVWAELWPGGCSIDLLEARVKQPIRFNQRSLGLRYSINLLAMGREFRGHHLCQNLPVLRAVIIQNYRPTI